MTQQVGERQAAGGGTPADVTIDWAAETNEQGGPVRWFGSWILGADGREGPWFYRGFGSEQTAHTAPVDTVGVRIRKWTSEGLDPEYVDVTLAAAGPIRT